MVRSHWDVLGVPEGSPLHVVKKAYKKKALKYHPDKNKSVDAAELFVQINEAYQKVSKPHRSLFDSLACRHDLSDAELRIVEELIERMVQEVFYKNVCLVVENGKIYILCLEKWLRDDARIDDNPYFVDHPCKTIFMII